MNASVRQGNGLDASEERWRDAIERDLGQLLLTQEKLPHLIEERVAAGIVSGVRQVVDNQELMHELAAKLSTRLIAQSGQQASQWLGNRILTAALLAVTGFGLAWLVKNGKI